MGGTSAFSSDGVTTQVAFTCDKSYSLAGTVTLKCLTNGSWDEATPTCGERVSVSDVIKVFVVSDQMRHKSAVRSQKHARDLKYLL